MLGQDAPEREPEPFPTGIAIGVGILFGLGLLIQILEKRRGLSSLERADYQHNVDAAEGFVKRAQDTLVRNLTSGNADCALAFKQMKRANLDLGWWRGEWKHMLVAPALQKKLTQQDAKFHNNQIALNRLFKSKCVLTHTPVQLGGSAKYHEVEARELLARANLEQNNMLKQLRRGDCQNASDTLLKAQLLRAEGTHEAGGENETDVPMSLIEQSHQREQKANALFAKTCLYGERDVLGPPPVIPSSLEGVRRRRAR